MINRHVGPTLRIGSQPRSHARAEGVDSRNIKVIYNINRNDR